MIDAAIGRTPLVRLEKVVEPEMAEVWMKVEVVTYWLYLMVRLNIPPI